MLKCFKDNKFMNLSVHDKELFKKYNEIWRTISYLQKKLMVCQCIIINSLELRYTFVTIK